MVVRRERRARFEKVKSSQLFYEPKQWHNILLNRITHDYIVYALKKSVQLS